ncbi:MAG: hypothetical protein RMK45_10895, partial [Armatimonadota bacterium]|nr:hypothetical protein [Armatimonadota bacterium]
TMSAFAMVTGIIALLSVPLMPDEMFRNAPSVGGIPPRWLLAITAAAGVVAARLCWVGLRNDPPSNWGKPADAPETNPSEGETP